MPTAATEDLPAASDWPSLLYGHVTSRIAGELCCLKGVSYLPDATLLLVTPRGLIRLMSRGDGRAQWSDGAVEVEVHGQTITLFPAMDWHPASE